MSFAEIKTLREKQANIATEARSKLDEIKDDTTPERAAEIESEFDAAMAEHDKIGERADRLEKVTRAEKAAREAAEEINEDKRPKAKAEGRGVDEGEKPSYRSAFHSWLRSNIPNGDPITAEERAVLRAGYQEVDLEKRAQTAGTDSAGGYTVPEEMREILVRSMLAWGPMYDPGVATEIVTSGGNAMPFPTVDDTAVTAGAHTEGATLTDDGGKDATFGTKQLDAYAFDTEWLRVSKELNDDSFLAMEQLMGSLLGERLGRIANSQLTVGTGSSAPNGIVTASAAGLTAAGTGAVTYDEILDLEHSVDPAYRSGPRVAYMFNDTTLLAIRKLKDGDGNYLWQMGNVQAGIPSTLNGRPYIVNQAVVDMATTTKSILFGDMSKYFVRKVGAPLIGAIQDKDFWPGFGIAGYIRFDGELSDTAAVKHIVMA